MEQAEHAPGPRAASSSFDVILCDHVVDHADDSAAVVAELDRLLVPGGLLYFTVNVHHPVHASAGRSRASPALALLPVRASARLSA